MADDNSWFDRVPGGYYRPRQEPQQNGRRQYDDYQKEDKINDRDDYDRRERRDSHRSSYDRGNRRASMSDSYARRSYDDYDRKDAREMPRGAPEDSPVPTPAEAAAGGFAAGVEVAHQKMAEDQPRRQSTYSGYVPYSNIYGGGNEQAPAERAFSPPPRSSVGSPQPHSMNQLSPPRRMSVQQSQGPPRMYDGSAYDDRSESQYGYERSRRARPRMSRLRSSSYDSYDSRYTRRPQHRDDSRDYSRPRARAGPEKTFDGSKRGLGYGAVGAIAGGLLGQEFGGATSTTIGAVLGGLGANMFEARERRKEQSSRDDYARDDEYRRGDSRHAERRRDDSSWTE